ncbi:MAG: hypothetical protein LBC41_03480, partial [Clostridiales bacterium]|nr:hypothetical protein [Clostridiales bacterium]
MVLKKLMCMAVIMALAASSLAGCGGKSEPVATPPPATPAPAATVAPAATAAPAAPAPTEAPAKESAPDGAITFEDGNFAFIALDTAPAAADDSELSIVDGFDGKALKVALTQGKTPFVAIDVSSLVKEKIADVKSMEATVLAEYPDGKFYAISGPIAYYWGADRSENKDSKWSIYLENKNPNQVKATLSDGTAFVPDAQNFFIIIKETDNAASAGE